VALVAADLDGDGNLDLGAGTQDKTTGAAVVLNRSQRVFAPAKHFDAGGMVLGLIAADLDGDGRPDLAGTTTYTDAAGQLVVSYSVWILRNRGGGDFAVAETVALDTPAQALAAGDLDGDGDVDLVAAGGSAGLRALRNDGAGRFPEIAALPGTGRPSSLTLADLDGDGRLDVALTNWVGQSITVMLAREAVFTGR
jgi:hypothetical protein